MDMTDTYGSIISEIRQKVEEMGDFQSTNMCEMTTMLADDHGGRRRKRMWRSDYITDYVHNAVSSLKT
jgi:hypothetical protein